MLNTHVFELAKCKGSQSVLFVPTVVFKGEHKGPPYEYNRVRLGFQWAVFIRKKA